MSIRPLLNMSLAVLFGAVVAASAAQASAALDPHFGDGGTVVLGFDPIGDATKNVDEGVVACAGPLGSLITAGVASKEQRLVVAWLTESGALDTRFSVDGKETIPVLGGVAHNAVGLCLPDGKVMVVYSRYPPENPEQPDILVIVRIDPSIGLPDPGFAGNGQLLVDLGQYGLEVGLLRVARGVNVGSGGDVLVTGRHHNTDGTNTTGFALRISNSGTVIASRTARLFGDVDSFFAAAGVAGDGAVWIAGYKMPAAGPRQGFLLRLDANTLALIDMPHPTIDNDFAIIGGRMLDANRMLLSGSRSTSKRPMMALATLGSVQTLELPVPGVTGGAAGAIIGVKNRPVQVAQLPDGSLLLGATAVTAEGLEAGMYFARAHIGANVVLRVDSGFASGGALITRTQPAGCAGRGNGFRRFTFWAGRPTAIGITDTTCAAPDDMDYLIQRLELSYFDNGFE